jgi:hypothetical protein
MPRLRTVELYRDDQLKLVAVEAVALSRSKFSNGCQVHGSVTPLAVVVCRPEGNNVLAVEAEYSRLDILKQQHPGLDVLIREICASERIERDNR